MTLYSRLGICVVVGLGIHDSYRADLGIYRRFLEITAGYPTVLVGVRCSLPVIMERRQCAGYSSYLPDGRVPEPIRRREEAVHADKWYDIEVDTSVLNPQECCSILQGYLARALKA